MTSSSTSNALIDTITSHNSLIEVNQQNTYNVEPAVAITSLQGKTEPAYFSVYCLTGTDCRINVQVDFKAISRQRRISDLNKSIK